MGDPTDLALIALFGALGLVVAGAVWSARRAARRHAARLRDAALVGRGQIQALESLSSSDPTTTEWILTMELHVPGQAPRVANVYHERPSSRPPHVGEWIALRIHPDHPSEIYLDDP